MFKKLLKLERKHKNLLFFLLGITLAYFFRDLLGSLGALGYLGALIGGALFASTFTAAIGGLILLTLAKTMNFGILVGLGALGAMTTDFLIFKFVKDRVVGEITPVYNRMTGSHLKKILHTRYFAWTLPVLGALIILLPLPDELGISLLGLEKIETRRFLLISWLSHLIGIGLICQIGRI